MKNRLRIVFGISIVSVLGSILWLVLRSHEPEPAYQGKPLHVWLKGFDANQGSAEYSAAQSAVQQIGTNALPTLISYLRRKDSPLHRQWINLKTKLHLLHGEVDYAVFWHRRAAQACGALGQDAEPAFAALTEAINDRQAASAVGTGLSNMMPKSVPVLTTILATGPVVARCRAADALMTAFSHPDVEPMARTALCNALHDADPGPRMAAASAFQFWNKRLDLVVPALTRALSDSDPGVRGNAATSLGDFGSAAKSAVPEMLKLLRDTNSYVSGTVGDRSAEMLLKIDPEAAARAGRK